MPKTKPKTVDEYIKAAPKEAQQKLREMRAILKSVAPKAKEGLKWGNPVFEEDRILFSYAAFKTHLNFFPTGPALKPFKDELSGFETGKDSIKLPYDKPLPKTLIRRIAAYRLKEVREKDAKVDVLGMKPEPAASKGRANMTTYTELSNGLSTRRVHRPFCLFDR